MTTPVPARAHANMSVAERELTFDSLLAEFAELDDSDGFVAESVPAVTASAGSAASGVAAASVLLTPVPDAAAPASAAPGAPRAARQGWPVLSRALLTRARPRALAMPSPEVLKLSGLIALAALSLTLVFISISR